jgi:hypothetical protein
MPHYLDAPRHTWELLVTNMAGTVIGQIYDPVDLKYTRNESGACELEFNTEDPYDLTMVNLKVHKHKVKAYRDGTLRFFGRMLAPLKINESGAMVKCADPWHFLNSPAHDNYTFVDKTLQEIAEIVIGGETAYNTRDLAYGSETLATTFSCKLKKGQRIGEFIESLCSRGNPNAGSWFRIDALDDPSDNSVIHFYDYTDRVDNAQARWEYGNDTLDNCTAFEVEQRNLLNKVRVYYKGGYEEYIDTDSVDEFGPVEKWFRRPGVDDAGTALKIATSKIVASPMTVGSFEPAANAPRIFDDFDVGDKCRAYFQLTPKNRLSGNAMYYSADDMIPTRVELTVDKNGVENMAFSDDSVHANHRHRKHSQRQHHRWVGTADHGRPATWRD